MTGIWRKVSNVVMRGFGYVPNEKTVRAEALFVEGVVKYLRLMSEVLFLDWRRIPAESAVPLVGYVYGLCKALAISAGEEDPEVFFFGTWRILYLAYPGRKDFEAILQRCEFTAPAFVEGRDLGFEDAALMLSGSGPVSRLTGLLARHCPHCIGNDLILQQAREKGLTDTQRPASVPATGQRSGGAHVRF
ncbi:hypothetical protein LJR296_008121 [Cupriavidus necator]|uniref:hypothetical protein n=1 Tax=Cupriavidus necator TaxID=106590 RepID=UPI003ED14650